MRQEKRVRAKSLKTKQDVTINPAATPRTKASARGPRIGPKRMTRYERSRVIGARALQISMGAPILIRVNPSIHDPIRIAEIELEKRVLPITIRRKLPSGNYEDVALTDLLD